LGGDQSFRVAGDGGICVGGERGLKLLFGFCDALLESAGAARTGDLGWGLSQRKIQKLISKSRITDLRNGGQHSYVSARRLFWVIRELQAVAAGQPEARSDTFRAADNSKVK